MMACTPAATHAPHDGTTAPEATPLRRADSSHQPPAEDTESGEGGSTVGDPTSQPLTGSARATQPQSGLPPNVIKRVMRDHLPEFRRCHEREQERDSSFIPRVSPSFVIGADGTVTSASSGVDKAHPDLDACILRVLEGMRFPPPQGGVTVTVSYPWH